MPHCAKCGAELIGSKKFCAACGTPAGDPRSPAASTGAGPAHAPAAAGSAPGGSGPSMPYAPAPVSQVNPFAQTAGPAMAPAPRVSDYGPPPGSTPQHLASTTPGVGDPRVAPRVSPLAVSNVLPDRDAFENALTSGPAEMQSASVALFPSGPSAGASAPASPDSSASFRRGGVPGTQLMPSMQNPGMLAGSTPSGGTPAGTAPAQPGRQDRTQLIAAFPPSGVSAASLAPVVPLPAPVVAAPAPASVLSAPTPAAPSAPYVPPAAIPGAQAAAAPYVPPGAQAAAPYVPPIAQAAAPYVPPVAQAAAPYVPPAPPYVPPPPPAMPGYGAGFHPGTRVTVTWSNGQRYPGTVQQMSGAQCLVVFPDGQHHWVDVQYVAPA